MITELDNETTANADLTSWVKVLTHTPDATHPKLCQVRIDLGQGVTGDLDGTGGNFKLQIKHGSYVGPVETHELKSGTQFGSLWSQVFSVKENTAVEVWVLSPNAADTTVDVFTYLYDVGVSEDAVSANVPTIIDVVHRDLRT